MDVYKFRDEYDGKLDKLGFFIEEFGSLHIKYGRIIRTSDNSYLKNRLIIDFDDGRINDIILFEERCEDVNGREIIKSKHTEHFKSMEELLAEIS